jgi:hypothetical protein
MEKFDITVPGMLVIDTPGHGTVICSLVFLISCVYYASFSLESLKYLLQNLSQI